MLIGDHLGEFILEKKYSDDVEGIVYGWVLKLVNILLNFLIDFKRP